jgi:glycolate oxidase FAD binding subunit
MTHASFALFDCLPSDFAAPGTIVEAQQVIREASDRAIVPWGGGTRQHTGFRPSRYDLALSTQHLNVITEYQPVDLVVTAQAGVTLTQLQSALAQQGQWLPLESALPDQQTVGGLIASKSQSLRRFAFGSVRDALIGVKVVDFRGDLVIGGGKVVKNVSGYDLPKLYCGSWGTLGLIVEATFKVSPRPESSAVTMLPLPATRNAEEVLDQLLESELEPSFLWLLNSSASCDILGDNREIDDAQYLLVGFDGPTEAVAWQQETLGVPALPPEEAASVCARLRDFPLADSPLSVTFHILSSQVGAFVRMVEWTARRAGFTAHCAPKSADANWQAFHADLADKALRVGGSCIFERLSDELRSLDVPIWTPILPDFALMSRMKATLDPQRMWNPGRFVGHL